MKSDQPPVEWRDGVLSELVQLQRGHDLPARVRRPGRVPVMGSAGLSGHHDEARARGPGVVIGRSGASFGKVHYCPDDYWPLNTALFATDFVGNEPRFVYYALKSIAFTAFNSGSAQASLNRNFIANIPVAIPPQEEQRRVADVLGGLDDKINSNRRVAALVEQLAATVFRARFADFVGVEHLEQSEIGEVPKGWHVGPLSRLVTQRKERCRVSRTTAALPYVPIDVIPARSLMLDAHRPGEEARSSLTTFEAGDILFGAMRPYFHKVAIAPFRGTTRTTVFVLRPLRSEDWAYTALLLSQPTTVEFATRTSRGSTIPYAVWDGVLSKMPVLVPPPDERAAFDEVVRPLLVSVQRMGFEQQALREIRNLILPKLVSGEIRMPDTTDFDEVIGPAAEKITA